MPQIDVILQAVFQLHKVNMTYKKLNQDTSNRIIRPYGVVIKENIWYMVGYCEVSYEIRMFRCDRITSCILLDETFLYPKNFTLRSYFNDTLQEFKGKCALEEQYLVTMTVSEKAFRYLKGMEYSLIWHEEDQWRICVNLYTYENAQSDYWNILMNAHSIEPAELGKAIRSKLTACLDRI